MDKVNQIQGFEEDPKIKLSPETCWSVNLRENRGKKTRKSSEKMLANHGDSLPTSIDRITLDCIIYMDQEKPRIESILDVMNIPEADGEQYQYVIPTNMEIRLENTEMTTAIEEGTGS